VPAAACGASDWLDTDGAERRVGTVHALVNVTALSAMAASYVLRRRGRRGAGIAVAMVGNGVAGLGGWLGGHLAYRLGVGVNTTAFEAGPSRWTEVLDATQLRPGQPVGAWADGAAVVVVDDGGLRALENRCTHRGGPLHEGQVAGGCISCPWHGSVFALSDGAVRQGPASVPQPTYEVRRQDGRIEVRRDDVVSLRTNPSEAERPLRDGARSQALN
jgi:nitrite reductase/ring-hydroxylating ferredoxin subunit